MFFLYVLIHHELLVFLVGCLVSLLVWLFYVFWFRTQKERKQVLGQSIEKSLHFSSPSLLNLTADTGMPPALPELPDEMLLNILAQLDRVHHLCAASAVCRRWHEVAKEDRLWVRLFQRDFPVSDLAAGLASCKGASSSTSFSKEWVLQRFATWSGGAIFPPHIEAIIYEVVRKAKQEEDGRVNWKLLYCLEAKPGRLGTIRPASQPILVKFPAQSFSSHIRAGLDYLGLKKLCSSLYKVPLLGLDNAGKTTLIHVLNDSPRLIAPTRPYRYDINYTIGDTLFMDFPGHTIARYKWRPFFSIKRVDAIIYMVDAAEPRFDENKQMLEWVFRKLRKKGRNPPVLILGNKIDRPQAVSESVLKSGLGLKYVCTGKEGWPVKEGVIPVELFMMSCVKRIGYGPGLKWMWGYMEGTTHFKGDKQA
jgi:GTP-binding protein SAR1